jgi:hypothetical protein
MHLKKIMEKLQKTPDCFLLSPTDLPSIPREYTLPLDLEVFYRKCGGAVLFESSAYGITIVPPQKFVRANPVIRSEEGRDDISYHWFIIAESGEQYITIDLNESRRGRCYDSFWDRHAFAGSCPIIAKSFSELLMSLLDAKGEHWYWLKNGFVPFGDAYD